MASTTLVTWEQFEQLPDDPGKRELLKGELIELPPPIDQHNKIALRILFWFYAALEQAHSLGEALSLGEVRSEAGYKLGGKSWLQPDVSVTHPGQPVEKYLLGSPAIAIEVVSPRNTPRILAAKTVTYFEFGALEVWHVYADEGHVVVHRPGAAPLTVRDFLTTPLLPGFTLNVPHILRG